MCMHYLVRSTLRVHVTGFADDANGTVELVQVLDDKFEPIPNVNKTSIIKHAGCARGLC
jgi:hypothetical protein